MTGSDQGWWRQRRGEWPVTSTGGGHRTAGGDPGCLPAVRVLIPGTMGDRMADELHAARMVLLRRFMREQRARWTREQVGLPSANGHKTLTREDLAALVGYAPAYITAFETGRMRNPTDEFLDAVSTALRMTHLEKNYLWHVARRSGPPGMVDCHKMCASDEDTAGLRELVDAEGERGNPALLVDPVLRVMAYNQATADWICDFDAHPDIDSNLLLWTFTHPHAQHAFADWRYQATGMLGRIRYVYAMAPEDPFVTQLITKLCDRSPLARQLWHEEHTVPELPRTKLLRIPGHTDPDQPNDADYQVKATMSFLSLPIQGDERVLLTLLLPPKHQVNRPTVSSEQACTACTRPPGKHETT